MLKMYNDLVDQIVANETVIRSLKERSQKVDFTAKQALFIMEQARYEAELEQYKRPVSDETVNDKRLLELMDRIESAAKEGGFAKEEEDESSEYVYGYEVKLQALR